MLIGFSNSFDLTYSTVLNVGLLEMWMIVSIEPVEPCFRRTSNPPFKGVGTACGPLEADIEWGGGGGGGGGTWNET